MANQPFRFLQLNLAILHIHSYGLATIKTH